MSSTGDLADLGGCLALLIVAGTLALCACAVNCGRRRPEPTDDTGDIEDALLALHQHQAAKRRAADRLAVRRRLTTPSRN